MMQTQDQAALSSRRLYSGIAYALAAGMVWGLVFVTPVWLPDYPPSWLSSGRYLAFGVIAAMTAWSQRRGLRTLRRTDWWQATQLSLVGNLLYYGCLSGSIQILGAPMPGMIIGTLPVVIAVTANRLEQRVAWRQLLGPLSLIALGLAAVQWSELQLSPTENTGEVALASVSWAQRGLGLGLALTALVCWTWYPIHNASWLQRNPQTSASTWATAQGLVTLPLATAAFAAAWFWTQHQGAVTLANPPQPAFGVLGPRPLLFIGLMVTLGLLASWLGTIFWNQASQRLPTALGGQLIVFETLSALTYAYLLRGNWPSWAALLGIGLLMLGVLLGVRVFAHREAQPAEDQAKRKIELGPI